MTHGPSGSGMPDREEETGPVEIEEQNTSTGAAVEQSAIPETTPGEEATTDSLFGNYNNPSNQPLRRSARSPNAKPRELYPGSVKYV